MSAPVTVNVASSKVTSSSPSSPGLYVPIHKRADSNSSSPSSPTSTLANGTVPSYVYSRDTLLSLLPFADENMKGKMRETCPEVVMNRKMRKGLEFNGRTELLVAKQLPKHEPIVVHKNPTPALQAPTTPTRVLPKRSRPAGRAPERRRNAYTSPFGTRRTGDDTWRRLQAVPMSPVILL